MAMLPTFFIAHGSPSLALEDNAYTQFLHSLGEHLLRPRAIVLFSAHWLAATQQISEVRRYETIHDFGGFPDALREIRYPAPGDPQLAAKIADLLGQSGIPTSRDVRRGLDHGAWVVLRLLYPAADIPVVSMSVNPRLAPEEQYRIGKALAVLREEDVLLIGSGGTVHNLGMIEWDAQEVNEWALAFDRWLGDQAVRWDMDALFRYEQAPHAALAVPHHGNEHFAPLFYAMGGADDARKAVLLHRSYAYGSLSHSVWQFG